MFTIEAIRAAHSKVKSGADFPAYIREIKQLGVTRYEAFVADGHTVYYGSGDFATSSGAWYNVLEIHHTADKEQFQADLLAHQKGLTDYMTFCNDCAKSGIEKWVVSLDTMVCTYYDSAGNEILEEKIPQ